MAKNPRAPALTYVEVAEATRLREAGWSLVRLGERYAVSHVTMSRTLRDVDAPRQRQVRRVGKGLPIRRQRKVPVCLDCGSRHIGAV